MASLSTAPGIDTSSASTNAVVGYFTSDEAANSALEALQKAGFSSKNIGVAYRSDSTTVTANSGEYSGTNAKQKPSNQPGVWDRIKNFFEGDEGKPAEPYAGEATNDSMNDREITPEYGRGEFQNTLSGLSVSDENARYFGHRFENSSEAAVIAVNTPDRAEEARSILRQYGADLGEEAADYAYPETASDEDLNTRDDQNIRLYGEVLRVHKDRVSRGEVRFRKEVYTETQTIQVPVTREELIIERIPVTGEQAASGATFTEQEIRIPLSEEVASVDKNAVLREEVRVGKREVTDIAALDGEVRREELKIDDATRNATTGTSQTEEVYSKR